MFNEKAKSISQQRLMGMAYACKKGDIECDGEVEKLSKSMSLKSLRKFAKTKHKNLPYKVKEQIRIRHSNILIEWLNNKDIQYEIIDGDVAIDSELMLSATEEEEFLTLINIQMTDTSEDLATLSNTVGLGAINPPSPSSNGVQPGNSFNGSGDRFDNRNADMDDDEDDDDEDDRGKKKKKHLKHNNRRVLDYDEVIKKINK